MKIRNAFEFLGFKKQSQRYGYTVQNFSYDGTPMYYAKWGHPSEKRHEIESASIEAYRKLLAPGDFCIDIGAHSGDSTLPMAVAVGTSGLTLALEPNPYVYHVLEKNCRLNRHLTNIESIQAAAAGTETVMTFEYSDPGYCNGGRHDGISAIRHGHAYKLQVQSIDIGKELRLHYAAWLPKLRLVKIDVEGFDYQVVLAMQDILREFRPILKVEVFKKTRLEYRQRLLALLEDMGYEVYRMEAEPVTPGPRMTQQNLEEIKHYDVLCFPQSQPSNSANS